MQIKLDDVKCYILDMDGTVYLGENPIKGAREFVERMKSSGRKTLFFTNNTSKDKKVYYQRLKRMGFDVDESDIYSSGDVTARFLKSERHGKSVYVVGTQNLIDLFRKEGIRIAEKGEKADIVVSSFDTTLTYEKLVIACDLIRGGAEYICTHPDVNCPTETGFIPDSGAISALISLSTGVKPLVLGKPEKYTADFILSVAGYPAENIAVVGDRLYTDIALGIKNGITGILVLSGETTLKDCENAAPEKKPTYVAESVADIM